MNSRTEKETLIRQTLSVLEKLSTKHIVEVKDFADARRKKFEEESLAGGMKKLMADSDSFSFLEEDEVEYSREDLKKKFK